MGKAVNQVFLIGRLTRDVEVRSTPQGKTVGNFSIAVDKATGNGADFFEVTAWEKLAELVSQYTHKGSKVHVQGSLQQQSWEQDGQKRNKIIVVARDITFLDSRSDAPTGGGYQNTQQQDNPVDVDTDTLINLDDIPF